MTCSTPWQTQHSPSRRMRRRSGATRTTKVQQWKRQGGSKELERGGGGWNGQMRDEWTTRRRSSGPLPCPVVCCGRTHTCIGARASTSLCFSCPQSCVVSLLLCVCVCVIACCGDQRISSGCSACARTRIFRSNHTRPCSSVPDCKTTASSTGRCVPTLPLCPDKKEAALLHMLVSFFPVSFSALLGVSSQTAVHFLGCCLCKQPTVSYLSPPHLAASLRGVTPLSGGKVRSQGARQDDEWKPGAAVRR